MDDLRSGMKNIFLSSLEGLHHNLRLPEQEASTPDSICPYASSRPSNEPLHDRISVEDHYMGHTRPQAILSYPARPRS